jgi:peptide/nickel transport system substrate-binding protein
MRRCWFFIFPISRFLPYGIVPRSMAGPVAGVMECSSLLAGHREITGEGEALLKEAGAEGLSFELLNCNVDQPFKYVATWLIDEWSKIAACASRR